jgi:hypothetical protein
MTPEMISKLNEWATLKARIDVDSKREMELRKELDASLFDASKVEGTQHIPLANGYKLTSERKLNYKATAEGMSDLQFALDKAGIGGTDLFSRIFRWKPEVNVTEYKTSFPLFLKMCKPALATKIQELFSNVVTITPGAPSLKLQAPEVK